MVALRLTIEVIDGNDRPIEGVEIIAVDSVNERNVEGRSDGKGIVYLGWLDASDKSYSFTIYAIKNKITTVAYNVREDYVMVIKNL